MPAHSGRGVLVAFEGIDGAGKTTQLQQLAEALRLAGQAVTTSREPTAGVWGRKIRDSAYQGRMELPEELEAFIRDRTEHSQNVITPALERGEIVLLDRYYYSTIAYQGARGANTKSIKEEMERRFPIPDGVILLDIDPSLAMYRISHLRNDTPNDFEKQSNLEAARSIFNSINDENLLKIDGSASVEYVHRRVVDAFVHGPFKKRRCSKAYGCDDPTHCQFRLTGNCEWWKSSRKIAPLAVHV